MNQINTQQEHSLRPHNQTHKPDWEESNNTGDTISHIHINHIFKEEFQFIKTLAIIPIIGNNTPPQVNCWDVGTQWLH